VSQKRPTNDEYVVRELRVSDPREAELLTDMWNRSEQGWPGGRTGGIPYTVERARQEFTTRRMHGQWVAEHRGEIVGYCNLLANPQRPEYAYVGLLNARPDHHGKGVGRRLIRRAIEQAIADGFERVDLSTWPGNLKAVPLYKKCGFFWTPETNVRMQNFIPTIVRMPIFGDFFRAHDWYQAQERDLAVAEDVDSWHGVRVYLYRFAAEGRRVGAICDRQAGMLTGVETDELYAAAWVGTEDLNALQEHTLHYELRNTSGRPVRVQLRAGGESGVPLAVKEAFVLDGVRKLAFPFRLPVDLPRKRPGEPPHRIITELKLNGVPVRLGAAVPKREPVEVEYSGQGVPAGKWVTLRIRLRNRLPFAARGTLLLESPPSIERADEALGFRIGRRSWTGLSLKVRASAPGAYKLGLRVQFSKETARRLAEGETAALPAAGKQEPAWLRAYAPGVIVLSRDAERREVTAESDRLLVTFRRVGGWVTVTDKAAGWGLVELWMPEVGPPFGDFQPLPEIYDVQVRRADGSVSFTARQRPGALPGIELERTLIAAPGMVQVRHRLANMGERPAELKVRFQGRGNLGYGTVTLPLATGFVRHRRMSWRDWPRYGEMVFKPADFAENWVAVEREGTVVGTVWGGAEEASVAGDGVPALTLGPVTVPAGEARDLPTVYVVAGGGDYKLVRNVWTTFVRPDAPMSPAEQEPPKAPVLRGGLRARPALLGLSARPVLLAGKRCECSVELQSEQRVALSGEATLRLPPCVAASGGRRTVKFAVAALDRDRPFRAALAVKASTDGPTAAEGELVFAAKRRAYHFPAPFVILGPGRGRVAVRQDGETVSVDNGRLRLVVAAAHSGSCVSLRSNGRELVTSSYPTPRPFWWMNPWHGGLRGTVGGDWDRRMHAARRKVGPVTVEGASGVVWHGAQVTTEFTHQDYRWLRGEVQYLTTPGSNVVAVVAKARNRTTGTGMRVSVGADLWLAGKVQGFVEVDGKLVAYGPDGTGYDVESESKWVCFRSGREFIAMTAYKDPRNYVGFTQVGDGTFCGDVERSVDLAPPYREQGIVAYVAVCRSLKEARAYRWLSELGELP